MIHVIGNDVVRISSEKDGPKYFGFSATVDTDIDNSKARAQLRLLFENDLEQFFNGGGPMIIKDDPEILE